jgi:hypothetical protein
MSLRMILSLAAPTLLVAATLCAEPAGSPPATGGSPERIRVFDARCLRTLDLRNPSQAAKVWDTMHTLAAVQGLANREAPRLYVIYCAGFGVETDQFWLDWLRGEDGWLKHSEVVPVTSPEEVVRTFRSYIKGLVILLKNPSAIF